MKNNPWNARNIANDICDEGVHSIGSHEFFRSDEKLHQSYTSSVRSIRFMLKSRKFEAFIFSLLRKERMSLMLNIITDCEIKKITSPRWKRVSRCLVRLFVYYIELRHIKFFLQHHACLLFLWFPPHSLFCLSILFLLSCFSYSLLCSVVCYFFVLCISRSSSKTPAHSDSVGIA